MKVKNKITGAEGQSSTFNPHALAEIIVYFSDGDCSSEFLRDYDVYLASRNRWVDMSDALQERMLIPDNYNLRFQEPVDENEKKKGWY